MVMSKGTTIFLDEKKVKELIKEVNDRIDLIHEYFTIDNDNALVTMSYEYRIHDLTVVNTAYFQNGFYSSTAESGDTYSSGLSLNHNIDEFSIFGYDYNYTDGTYYTNRLNFETGGNIRVAINNPNAKFTYNDNEVATEQDMEYLQKQLTNLEYSADGMTFTYEENSDIAYEKDVPSGASPYAVISKVGGMSYASSNLIELKDKENTDLGNGVTYSIKDGIITLNGTSTVSNIKVSIPFKTPLPIGTYTLKSFGDKTDGDVMGIAMQNGWQTVMQFPPINLQYFTKTTTDLGYYFIYNIVSGNTYTNFKIKPMLVRGSTEPTEFVPYFEGIRDSVVTNIASQGQNLYNLPNEVRSIYGYSIRCLNGEIYFTGQSTQNGNIRFDFEKPLPAGQYTLSMFNNYNSNYSTINYGFRCTDGSYLFRYFDKENATYSETIPKEISSIFIGIPSTGLDLTGFTCYPMVVKVSTPATEFKPYKLVNKSLPMAVKTLTDYGLGINEEYYNYIDLLNKKYVRKVSSKVLDETLTFKIWNSSTSSFIFEELNHSSQVIANTIVPSILLNSSFIKIVNRNDLYNGLDYGISISGSSIYLRLENISTVDELNNYLSSSPITLIYPLETPIEEDISYLLKDVDEFIEVEELGSITFENEYKNDTTSNITYQVKIV